MRSLALAILMAYPAAARAEGLLVFAAAPGPAGIYARQWLAPIWEKLKPKIIPTLDVRAALAAVEGHNAGAAVVYSTDARLSKSAVVAFAVPLEEGPKIVYVAALIT